MQSMLRAAARRGIPAARQQARRKMSSNVSHEEEVKERIKWQRITFVGAPPRLLTSRHWRD